MALGAGVRFGPHEIISALLATSERDAHAIAALSYSHICTIHDVGHSDDIVLSQPGVLFEQWYGFGGAQTVASYDVSPDGERFVMVKNDAVSGCSNIVLNWFEELKEQVRAQ